MSDILDPQQRELLQSLITAWQGQRREFATEITIPGLWSDTRVGHPGLPNGSVVMTKHDFDALLEANLLRISKPYGQGIGGDMMIIKFVVTNAGVEYLHNWEDRQKEVERSQKPWRKRWNQIVQATNHQVLGGLLVLVIPTLIAVIVGGILFLLNYYWDLVLW